MIKIELTDLHLLDKKILRDTANYLIALSDTEAPIAWESPTQPPAMLHDMLPRPEAVDIVPHPTAVCESTPAYEGPMPPSVWVVNDEPQLETVVAPPPETIVVPSEIFNPANNLPKPPGYAPPKIEVDSEGRAWDARIHSKSKAKMKDGTWKKRRLVDAQTIKQVESVPVAPPVTEKIPDFADLMTLVTSAITKGKLKREQVNAILKPFDIPSLAVVSTRLDLIPAIIYSINEVIDGKC